MTSYTNVFGGNTIKPADVSYTSIALTSNLTLSWPGDGGSIATSAIVEVTPDAAGRSLRMPSALRVAPGESVTFRNIGANSFSLQDNTGGSIVTIGAGAAYTVYVRDNSTAAGAWSYWQAGAGASLTDAGALDGAGLEAANGLLRVRMIVNSYTSPQAFSDGDRGSLAVWTGGSGSFTMPSAVSVGEGWFMHLKNDGSGTLQIAAPMGETFDGASDITIVNGESATIVSDGVNFSSMVSTDTAAMSNFSYSAIAVAGSGTYTLNAAEHSKVAIRFTGILTGNRTIIVPSNVRDYWITNATTGAFTLTVKTAAGSGVVVTQGKAATLYSDGINVVAADTDYPAGIATPVSVANGGTGASTADAALNNLGGTSVGKQIFTAASAANARSAAGAAALSGGNTFGGDQVISVNSTGPALRITQIGSGNALLVEDSSNPDSTPTVIDANGNVGMGTIAPAHDLEVTKTKSGANTELLVRNTDTGVTSAAYAYVYQGAVQSFFGSYGNQIGIVGTSSSHPFVFQCGSSERMRITNSGNVGIGAATVLDRLHVADGNIRLDGRVGDNFNGLIVKAPGASASAFRGGYVNTHNENDWAVAGIEFDLLQNGASGIYAQVTPSGARTSDRRRRTMGVECDATAGRLYVVGASGTADTEGRIELISEANNGTRPSYVVIRHRSSAASGDWYNGFIYNGNLIGTITQSGTTGVAYNTSSDYRLKGDVTPMTNRLAAVMALNPVTYTWHSDGSSGQGFLAHELQAVIPDAVTGTKDAEDANGNPVYQGVDFSRVVPTLVAAIQEQQAQIAALTARIEALENAA